VVTALLLLHTPHFHTAVAEAAAVVGTRHAAHTLALVGHTLVVAARPPAAVQVLPGSTRPGTLTAGQVLGMAEVGPAAVGPPAAAGRRPQGMTQAAYWAAAVVGGVPGQLGAEAEGYHSCPTLAVRSEVHLEVPLLPWALVQGLALVSKDHCLPAGPLAALL
jgi:hypothetical protein